MGLVNAMVSPSHHHFVVAHLAQLVPACLCLQTNGVRALAAALPYNQCMVQLCLKDNSVGKNAVPFLVKGLAMNRSIKLLDLSTNPIGPQGTATIAELLNIKHRNCCPVGGPLGAGTAHRM